MKNVRIFEKLTHKELKEKLQQAHCVLISSVWVETGPLIFHEALACGANVIASNIGGNKELAEYYKEGCTLYNFKSYKDLKEKIETFKYSSISHQIKSQEQHLNELFEFINPKAI